MNDLEELLSNGDPRSLGEIKSVIDKIKSQEDFDGLFTFLSHSNRIVVMRSSDAVEKISRNNPKFLQKHKGKIFELCQSKSFNELKWHLALLLPRLSLSENEKGEAWEILTNWTKNKENSKIVRVNSLQGLYEMSQKEKVLLNDFELTILEIEMENIPSINARIKKIRSNL